MSTALERHEIPTHLEVEDRILFGLTVRQGILALIGCSISYSVYAQLGRLSWPGDPAAHLPVFLRVALAVIPALLALALALVQPAGRPLEEWVFALARYRQLPKQCTWSATSWWEPDGRSADDLRQDAVTTDGVSGQTGKCPADKEE